MLFNMKTDLISRYYSCLFSEKEKESITNINVDLFTGNKMFNENDHEIFFEKSTYFIRKKIMSDGYHAYVFVCYEPKFINKISKYKKIWENRYICNLLPDGLIKGEEIILSKNNKNFFCSIAKIPDSSWSKAIKSLFKCPLSFKLLFSKNDEILFKKNIEYIAHLALKNKNSMCYMERDFFEFSCTLALNKIFSLGIWDCNERQELSLIYTT